MTEKLATKTGEPIGYNFIIGSDLGSGRSIQITGVLPVGTTKEILDSEFDKILGAFNRQLAKVTIDQLERSIDEDTLKIEALTREMHILDDRYSTAGKSMSTAERAGRDGNESQIRAMVARKTMNEAQLEKVKAQV